MNYWNRDNLQAAAMAFWLLVVLVGLLRWLTGW